MTVHRWSGVGDCRFDSSEIVKALQGNAIYSDVISRVNETDVLIIDECSMLSRRLFESLDRVCAMKNPDVLFGGIQLILVGDFLQLPPVPCARYNEDGAYCFESDIFAHVLPHRVVLTDVVRQSDIYLVKAIQEVSQGTPSTETCSLLKGLARPLPETLSEDSVQLFSTNELVDDFNRDKMLQFPGPLLELKSNDEGEKRYFTDILAPKVLWLKNGAPVILLRNISEVLVNGLFGEVCGFNADRQQVAVHFPALKKPVTIEKIHFEVFDPRKNAVVAVREQYPLKPAFGLTIHKSQGMSLDCVEVDCREIFKPGQLGVAIGRARTLDGLRVVNFTERACIEHPKKVIEFMNNIQDVAPTESCCRYHTRSGNITYTISTAEMKDIHDLMYVPADGESVLHDTAEEFDAEFDDIITIIADIDSCDCENIELPDTLNLQCILAKMNVKTVLTPVQFETNEVLSRMNYSKYVNFCKQEYRKLTSLLAEVKKAVTDSLTTKQLGEFYTKVHHHTNSIAFRMNSLALFETENIFTNAHMHICFNISVEIRKFIISEKAQQIALSSRQISSRKLTTASRARVRYIGGYCVAKIRHKYVKRKESHRYSMHDEDRRVYEDANCAEKILNNLMEEEQYLLPTTDEPESLLDVSKKQNVNRGLTNISDNLFAFFVKLTEKCLSLLIDENLNKTGGKMFEHCRNEIMSSISLFEIFSRSCFRKSVTEDLQSTDWSIDDLMVDMTSQIEQVEQIYKNVIKLHLMVLFNQFRKDLLDSFQVEKKMAHRKQVTVSTSKSTLKASTSTLTGSKRTKEAAVKLKSTARAQQEPSPEPSPSCDSVEEPMSVHELTESAAIDDSNLTCKICDTTDKETQWMQCESCESWLHRGCAGLKHHMSWKRYQKKSSSFSCKKCCEN